MKEVLLALFTCTVFAVGISLLHAQNTTAEPSRAALDIGATPIDLDSSYLAWADTMRVFVPTGSTSPNCLVTLRESNDGANIRPVFCGPRTLNGRSGVLLTLFFINPPASNVVVGLTLYHHGARFYSSPELYNGE